MRDKELQQDCDKKKEEAQLIQAVKLVEEARIDKENRLEE